MPNQVIIHAQPSSITRCQANELNWEYSSQFGLEELDIIVDNQDELNDVELCAFYGLDYNQVNCIELI